MPLQPQERPTRQPDVVALRPLGAGLATLHPAGLLRVPLVLLGREAHLGVVPPHPRVHRQVAGRPVFRDAVRVVDPEATDQAVPLETDRRTARRDRALVEDAPTDLATTVEDRTAVASVDTVVVGVGRAGQPPRG